MTVIHHEVYDHGIPENNRKHKIVHLCALLDYAWSILFLKVGVLIIAPLFVRELEFSHCIFFRRMNYFPDFLKDEI